MDSSKIPPGWDSGKLDCPGHHPSRYAAMRLLGSLVQRLVGSKIDQPHAKVTPPGIYGGISHREPAAWKLESQLAQHGASQCLSSGSMYDMVSLIDSLWQTRHDSKLQHAYIDVRTSTVLHKSWSLD